MPRISDLFIRNFPAPEKRVTIWDGPLGLRVTPNGAKTFIVMLGSGRRYTIGRYGNITLAQAREAAGQLKAEKTLGRVFPQSVSLQTARQEYLDQLDVRPNTRLYYERNLNRLKQAKLADITPREITRVLDGLGQSSRNQALASFRTFFKWCMGRHYLDRSPCERMTLRLPNPRSRLLTADETKAVWKASAELGWPFGTLTQLALVLGQRRGELAALRWSWIDTKDRLITFPKEVMKGGKPHTIPYGDMTAQIFAGIPNTGDILFPARGKSIPLSGFSKFKTKLDKLSKVADWTLHDCRRVLASGMAASAVPIHVIERYLSHTSGTLSGIVAVYQRHSWMPEMRLAVEAYEAHLQKVISSP